MPPALAGGGAMGARIRDFDWQNHPLGPPADWPRELQVALSLALHSAFPTAIYWGPELRLLYNDAWAPIPAERHPWALGRPGPEVWADIWDVVGPQMDAAMRSGEGFSTNDQLLRMVRDGAPRDTWWNYSFSPIVGEDGGVLGLLNQGQEVTEQVRQRDARAAEIERMRAMFAQAPAAIAVTLGPEHRFAIANPAYNVLTGHRNLLDRTVAEALPEVVEQGFVELLDTVYRSGVAHRAMAAPVMLEYEPGTVTTRMIDFVYQPIRNEDGATWAIFIEANDVTDRWKAEQAVVRAVADREFVYSLAEQQRAMADPAQIARIAAAALVSRFAVERAGFFEVDASNETVRFGACATNGAVEDLSGEYRVSELSGPLWAMVARGELSTDQDFNAEARAALAELGLAAALTVPIVRDDRVVGGVYLHGFEPREWTAQERQVIGEVAQGSWDAGLRAAAHVQLRDANRKLAVIVRQRTEERDRIWEFSRDLLGVADSEGVWVAINPAWRQVLGWDETEILGRTSEWLEHPDDRAATAAEIGALGEGRATHLFINRFRRQDGSYSTLSWTAVPHEGQLYCTARDITEEMERDAALRLAEARTRLALSAINGVGTYTLDPAADVLRCDESFARLYGIDPREGAMGVPVATAMRNIMPEDLDRIRADIIVTHAQPGDSEHEYRLEQPDGSISWVMTRTNAAISPDTGRLTVTGVAVDTTEQHRLEDALRQAQKMEAVGQLTGGLAHDFNNMLMGISGALEMIPRRLEQGRAADIPRYIEAAQGAARRAAALTHRLLAFSRRQTLDPRATDIRDLVLGLEDILRRAAGPAVALSLALEGPALTVLVDPNQLESALLNLVINARDAMSEGGSITIAAEARQLAAAEARDFDLLAGDYVRICVSDTGKGIPADLVGRVFDPFFTTKPMGEGTGLGLSMVYGFVRQSGGSIRIDSAPGRGTTICLLLPRHGGAVEAAEVTPGGTVPQVVTRRRVLVVDDEPTIRMLVSEALSEHGLAVVEAADAASALAIAREGGAFDLLVTDVGLPGEMNGRQLAERLRAEFPALRVLMITGFAEQSVLGGERLPDGMAVLTKPFSIDTLARRVAELADS